MTPEEREKRIAEIELALQMKRDAYISNKALESEIENSAILLAAIHKPPVNTDSSNADETTKKDQP